MPRLLPTTFSIAWQAAWTALGKNLLRSLLTACGILVGVSAVTTVVTLGDGADQAIKEQVENLGENLVTIRPHAVERSGIGKVERRDLSDGDVDAIEREIADAERVAPVVETLVRVVSRERNASAQAVGTTLDYFQARNYRLASGTLWDAHAEKTAARVVLLGPSTSEELFGRSDPVGEHVRIGRQLFLVIGLLQAKGQTPFGMDQDSICLMPLDAMRNKVLSGRRGKLDQVLLSAHAGADSARLKRELSALLRQRHDLEEGDEDDFSIRDTATIQNAQQGVVNVMRLLLLSLAALSLLIGGIGVMNIMLVGVTERSREIGTRLALGATAQDIMLQFLIEAVLLSLFGGMLGAALTFGLVPALEAYFGWPLVVSLRALAFAGGVSFTVGVLFGILPARRAARLDPVVALRRE